MSEVEHVDVAVIGAGPGGSSAAAWAARGGANVALFEKASRGRDKSCGDGLTRPCLHYMDDGVDLRVDERGPRERFVE